MTGDIHGEVERFSEKEIKRLKKQDTLIVLGDFGFLWSGDKAEQKKLKWLQKHRYQLLFIDGCHENFDLLKEYPEVDYMGGRARHIGGNLYYIERGSILEIEGKKLLCFGGAESWDKEDRDEGHQLVACRAAHQRGAENLRGQSGSRRLAGGLYPHPRRTPENSGICPADAGPAQLAAHLLRPDHG